MLTLELFLILMLQFEAGTRGEELSLYHRVGDDVVLPCNSPSSSYPCDIVTWLYNRDSKTQIESQDGKVSQNSARAARLSLDSECSLLISNITAQDYGLYVCRLGSGGSLDGLVFLNILNISPPDAGPSKDGDVTLKCSLLRHSSRSCPEKSLRWVDESGAELLGEDDGSTSNCVSSLTVKHQRGGSRRFTCRFFQENNMKLEVHYTSVSEDSPQTNSRKLNIIIGSVIGVVLLLVVVVVAAVLKHRRRTRITGDQKTDAQNPNHHYDEIQSGLTYATVNHFNQGTSRNIKVKEEENTVTYSTVRTNMKTETDVDPSSLYSCVSKPK